jgi:DtxR family Mn-dependent transcriptional regulator
MRTLTPTIQNYLKAIYILSGGTNEASTSDLAAYLEIKPASVTEMLQKLSVSTKPLIAYKKHQGARLTPEGIQAALEILRHHRLLETYLVRILGYTWDSVHEEACRLEHVISEEFETRIAQILGEPTRDPHGAPIPSSELLLPVFRDVPLINLSIGAQGIIRHIQSKTPTTLRQLGMLGIMPGTPFTITTINLKTKSIGLILSNKTVTVTEHIAHCVQVEIV